MEKKFSVKPAEAIKNVKTLASKYESAIKLGFLTAGVCCMDTPIVGCTQKTFSL